MLRLGEANFFRHSRDLITNLQQFQIPLFSCDPQKDPKSVLKHHQNPFSGSTKGKKGKRYKSSWKCFPTVPPLMSFNKWINFFQLSEKPLKFFVLANCPSDFSSHSTRWIFPLYSPCPGSRRTEKWSRLFNDWMEVKKVNEKVFPASHRVPSAKGDASWINRNRDFTSDCHPNLRSRWCSALAEMEVFFRIFDMMEVYSIKKFNKEFGKKWNCALKLLAWIKLRFVNLTLNEFRFLSK